MEFRPSSSHGLLRIRYRGRPGRALSIWATVLIVAASLLSSQPAPVRAAAVAPDDAPTTGPSTAPAGNLVDNGSFETPDIAGFVDYFPGDTDITKWTIDSGSVDIVSAPLWEAPDGSQVLDLDGSNGDGSNGFISQDIPTTPNTAYELGFQYSGNPDCGDIGLVGMDVIWDGINVGSLTHDTEADPGAPGSLATFDYDTFTVAVVGSFTEPAGDGRTKLEFRSNSGPQSTCGIVIDDVYVVHASPPVWQALGDGTTTVIEDGSDGPPQFTYSYDPGGASGVSGEWGFFTTATTTGSIGLDWSWTGLHAFAGVTVGLEAFVVGFDGGDVSTPLLAEGPNSCITFGCVGQSPSGGHSYVGTATVNVEPGDTYGFVLTGGNGDINTLLTGRFVVDGTPALPLDCAGVLWRNPDAGDGDYTIQPRGQQPFEVSCDNMEGAPREYLTLAATGPGENVASYGSGGAAPGTDVVTKFTKLRINPPSLLVDIGDLTYSTSSGSLTHPDVDGSSTVLSMPYGVAMACNSTAADNGVANIDLTGTPFSVDDTFTPVGTTSGSFGGATFSAGNQVVDIEGNGGCGWRTPFPYPEGPFYVFNPSPAVEQYGLQLTMDPVDPVALATPSLIRAISGAGNTALLIGRIDGAPDTAITVEVTTADTCIDGVLQAPIDTAGAPPSTTTDPDGYFGISVTGVVPGDYVAARVTSPSTTDVSSCVVSSGDNDYWPKALELSPTSLTARDVIDSQGKARWYKFAVTPGERIEIKLSGLPADYDMAVFKDIGATFRDLLTPANPGDLTELSAEYAPSVFSPSVFSPSVFSPSVFSPDAYSPSVFSPSVFSPSVFSPSVFSPSVFSPSVFSPSVFSPSVFSPSVFSPSVFSPSVFSTLDFSPSVFSDADVAQAFSSAQTRSIIGVSATPGTGDETVVVNSWNNSGEFYVRVAGHRGAFDTGLPFQVDVAKGATSCGDVDDTTLTPRDEEDDTGLQTIILTDSSALDLGAASLGTKLESFAGDGAIDGEVIDLATDDRVQDLKDQADENAACPYAMNLVAEEVKGIVDSYRANPLRYVVIVGDDGVIPFFRYPDQSLLGQESGYVPPVRSDSTSEASLRGDFVLSQDAYGAGTLVSLRASEFPVPGLAVGRLIETPAEIAGQLDEFGRVNGQLAPTSSLVTGYDFLEDAALAVKTELQLGTNTAPDTLITPNGKSPEDPASWTAAQLNAKLLGSRHDINFLAGHFSANSALAADFKTSLLTTDLDASPVDLRSAIVFSAGCHSGYNLVDGDAIAGVSLPLDWAQAFARKKSILIAGTGYQYGDTDFLEYSERLYRDFARELRAGESGTAISVGEALVRAKLAYLATTPDIRGIHEKAILEATLFGLPMFGVVMPAGREDVPGTGGPITATRVTAEPAFSLGLAAANLHLGSPADFVLTAKELPLKNPPYDAVPGTFTTAKWLSGPNGVVTNPAEPAVPLVARNATSTDADHVLRGVGFRGGTYIDTANIVPLTGAPTTELRGVHAPFVSPVFYPMRLWNPNYFGALGGQGGTNLLVTPVQHKNDPANPGKSIQRKFTGLDLQLFYSNNLTSAALSDAPTIVDVQTEAGPGGVTFTAQVVGDPLAAIHGVWVTWTDGSGTWASLDLVQDATDSRLWTATLASPLTNLQFVAQAVNGLGLVSFDDNRGAYYQVAGSGPAAAETTLEVIAPATPASGTFGQSPAVTVELKAGPDALPGKAVFVSIGGSGAFGTTAANGRATVNVPLSSIPGETQITASFGGTDGYLPSSDTAAPFTIVKATASLSPFSAFVAQTSTTGTGVVTTLTAPFGGPTPIPVSQGALIQRTVTFTLTGPANRTISTITNYLGQAKLPPGLPAGTYNVTAMFDGDATYTSSTRSGTLVVAPFTGFFSPVDNLPTLNTVNAGATIPVKFSLGGNRTLAIFAAGYPLATKIACQTGLPSDAIEETSTLPSGLAYDPAANQYKYSWKTPKNYAGLCYRLDLKMIDGSTFSANFKFK